MAQPPAKPPFSAFSSSAAAPRPGGLKKWLFTLLKIAIAVAGIWWVLHKVNWDDSAVIPANGRAINTLTFVEDVPVTVIGRTVSATGKPQVRIAFPSTPIKVKVEMRDGTERIVEMVIQDNAVIPGTSEQIAARHELDVDRDLLKEEKGENGKMRDPVQEGLHSLLLHASDKWYLLLGAWALLGVPFLVTAIRWRNLMRPQGIDMPLGKCLQLTMVGQFYSIMLPGITGGDLVKIVYAARLTGSKTKSFITIILDRVIGLVALMVIAGASAGVQLILNARGGVAADNTLLNVFVMIIALLALIAAGATVYFSHRLRKIVGIEWFVEHFSDKEANEEQQHAKLEHLFRMVNVLGLIFCAAIATALAVMRWGIGLHWAHSNTPLVFTGMGVMIAGAIVALAALLLHTALVARATPIMRKLVGALVGIDETLRVYRGHFGLLFWAFTISLISQLSLPLSAWLSGTAFGMNAPMTHYLAYVPVAVLAASLPISPPQGFGIMDWLLLHFFAERGTARAGQAFALAQAVRFLPMLWNLIGAYWVVTGSYSREKVKAEAQES